MSNKSKANPAVLKWLYGNSRSDLWKIVLLTLMAVAASYISVRFALASKEVLDAATVGGGGSLLWSKVARLAVLVVFQLVIQISYTMIQLHTETALKNRIQRKLFSSMLRKKYEVIKGYHSGELLNRLNGDINIVNTSIMTIVPNVFAFASRIVMSFAALYVIDSQFALFFLIIGPFVMLVARLYSKKIKPLHKKCQECHGRTQSFMLEALQNILVVKSFGAHSRMENGVADLQKQNYRMIMKRGYLSIFANILFYVSLTIGYYFAVAWCAWKIAAGIMTVGSFTAVIQLVGQIQTPFKDLASVIPQFFAMTASAERVMEVENAPDEQVRYPDLDFNALYENMKCISVRDVNFAYDNEQIFDSASVDIPKDSLVAISGISGIGKSTLLKLVLGMYEPSDGFVGVRCKDGREYVSDASMRNLFAYVPQGNMLLSGTIRENITFMSGVEDEERIIEAAKTACIYNVIKDMPDGFDTVLGEGGGGLSEGQLQRLAVARAICSGAPVLLLDEATSALDEETEYEMLSNIKALKNRTCVIISHKECAVKLSDMVITIQNKRIK